MASQKFFPYAVAACIVLTSIFLLRRRQAPGEQLPASKQDLLTSEPSKQILELIQHLLSELPECVILDTNQAAFQEAVNYYWAQQNREIIPACIVRPRDLQELSKIVVIFKQEHDRRLRTETSVNGFFAIRSGGANASIAASTIQNGVVVDLSLFDEVTPAKDRSTVTIGTGAKWIDVYKKLDETGLVVIGGRNSPVGVGGLTLQGGISFYSPKFGFVCSNVVSYEVVLADGSIVTASEYAHPELWRALKGGSNNFGVVTRFVLRSIPAAPLWSTMMVGLAAFQHTKALEALHDYLEHSSSGQLGAFDENAAGPILTFVYIQQIGLKLISLNLTYTKASEGKKWPLHWRQTGFTSLWSVYRSTKVHSHTFAVERFGRSSPAGTRHVQGTTTIRNDIETLKAVYDIFCHATTKLRKVNGLLFPFNFQVILPEWMNKGYSNVLGLEGCTEPLIIINCSVTWTKAGDDEFVRSTVRDLLEQIDEAAVSRQADHPYKFMNYCMEWQRPYEGCGNENLQFMRNVSRRYDANGLFQSGCVGGFKLGSVP